LIPKLTGVNYRTKAKKSRLKQEPIRNKKPKKSKVQKTANLTDEQRVEKLLDLIAEIVVEQTLKKAEEQKIKGYQSEKEQ
jgi:hypothetical protein